MCRPRIAYFNARSNIFPLGVPASMSTPARLEELKRDLAQMENRQSGPRWSGGGSECGREADHPGETPPKGWMDVLWRAWGEVSEQNLFNRPT